MGGFTGFKTAAAEEIPKAMTVIDRTYVIRLAGDALDLCRRPVQVELYSPGPQTPPALPESASSPRRRRSTH